jgi:hypothetical protein
VGVVVCAEDHASLGRAVRSPDLLDVQNSQQGTLWVAQGKRPVTEVADDGFRHVKHDRDRPERAVGEPHGGADRLVVGSAEEPLQRGEGARQQQLQVAKLPLRQFPGLPVSRPFSQLLRSFPSDQQVDQPAAMGPDQVVTHALTPASCFATMRPDCPFQSRSPGNANRPMKRPLNGLQIGFDIPGSLRDPIT